MSADDWPTGRYAAVVADPPWDYGYTQRLSGKGRRGASARAAYSTLTVDQVAALPVAELLEPGGHLWLWVPNAGMLNGWHTTCLHAWGLRSVALVTWVKRGQPTLGRYARGTTEHVVLAVNGWGGVPDVPLPATHFDAAKGAHSVKPPTLADYAERLKPDGPWLELFARQQRIGWSSWGHGVEAAAS